MMRLSFTASWLNGSCLAALAFVPSLALAQSASSSVSDTDASNSASADFTDIVVTAQKRAQKLNDVGLTITAVTGDVLARRQISSLQDIANAVPSLSYTRSITGTPIYTLRGVGFYDTSLAGYPTTSVYVDEVALPFSNLAAHSAYDLDHLEVLKGPQGTLFGQNSTGGAINYVANKPTSDFATGGTISYGRFNQVNAEAYLSGPISDKISARLSGRMERQDGWQVSNSRPDDRNGKVRTYMGRLIVDFQPSDAVRFSFNANGWIDNSETQAAQFIGLFPQFPGLVPPSVSGAPFSPLKARAADWTPGIPYSRNRFWQTSLRSEVDITEDVVLTSITAYAHYKHNQGNDNDGLPTSSEETKFDRGTVKSFSQELRLSNGGGSAFRWVVGGNYSRDSVYETLFNFFPDSSANSALGLIGYPISQSLPSSSQKMRNIAGFANGEYDVTDKLTVKVGGRYTDARRTTNNCNVDPQGPGGAIGGFFYDVLLGGAFGPYKAGDCFSINFTLPGRTPEVLGGIAPGSPGRYRNELKENNFSWRAGLDYKVTPDILLYANISKGYKAGSFPIQPASNVAQFAPVTQESVLSYEGGFKATLLDRALQLNGAAFYYKYKDKQLRTQYNDIVFGVLGILANIPKSSIKGFELEATARPARGVTVGTAFTYLDATIDEFVGDDVEGGPAALGTQRDYSGSKIPYTPKYQVSVNADYEFPLSGSLNGFVGSSISMRSAATASIGGRNPVGSYGVVPVLYRIDSYFTVDAQLGVSSANNRYRVSLWAKNLTNEYYFNNSVIAADAVARYVAMPRTYGVALSLKFD
jgi:iron complex outermembrane receptor protein